MKNKAIKILQNYGYIVSFEKGVYNVRKPAKPFIKMDLKQLISFSQSVKNFHTRPFELSDLKYMS